MEFEAAVGAQNGTLEVRHGLSDLPEEILELLRTRHEPRFLERLAVEALKPQLTTKLWATFHHLFADTAARWSDNPRQGYCDFRIIEGYARILPLAPHLQVFLERYLETALEDLQHDNSTPSSQILWRQLESLEGQKLQSALLALFRLLELDKTTFSQTLSAVRVRSLLDNNDRSVRYLALRIYSQLLGASDYKLDALHAHYVGLPAEPVLGDFDGGPLDYGFLGLFEETRMQEARKLKESVSEEVLSNISLPTQDELSQLVVRFSDTIIPRPFGVPARPSVLVPSTTTLMNQESLAKALLLPSPLLLHGFAGSGKTSLVNDFARELGSDATMVTLHLNEQTDAKMLIGMYASGSRPGSFKWRPGVLTTAVREGRWVLIEDLDRAPNEVISVILPLIEQGQLLIPSRGETIQAGRGFRLFATIRTTPSLTGQETAPATHMLGSRLWQRVPVRMPSQVEFSEIIVGIHTILHRFVAGIINVYERLYTLSNKPTFASRSRTSLGRPISPRDLLKWCRRMEGVLIDAGVKTGDEPINEATQYEMFLEATDCFSSSLQTAESRATVISAIAEEMHINPQRVEHFLTAHVPRYEESESRIIVGRVRLPKRSTGRISKPVKTSRPFANTTHAKRLLEQVGVAVKMSEPVLLVGETGIGKTTVVQQLADSLGFKLTAVNLSQQSEVGDLLGGFKPVNVRTIAIPLKDEFDDLFSSTGISATKNQKYLDQLGKCIAKGQWTKAVKLWREAPKMFNLILSELSKREADIRGNGEQPVKRRKTESRLQSLVDLKPRWERFSQSLEQFEIQLSGGSKGFAFTFVEGNIVKAARNGDWVLLDEINLASPDTLEGIADLLQSGAGNAPSILLSETGDIERVKAHPNFRIFGAMNPATDVGKRDLPMGLRSRFTEIYVDSPDRDLDDLLAVIKAYLRGTSQNDERAAHDVARLYLNTKRLADEKRLVDGANQVPHFSLRNLTRVLSYVNEITPSYGLRRALYEGFAMGFLTLLNSESEKMLVPLINHHLLDSHGNPQALLSQTPRHPDDGKQYVRFLNKNKDRQYWMLQGPEPREVQAHYIMTPFVERNMLNLVRATSTRRFPVLVQGPTSSGKTSMIEYLAKFSGNKFVRINNHEHTDLQEYLGTYVSGADGQLRFQEGLLVQALRQGHWIVLDELNLAPTDVLEALNRLLDDNRELLIPETQEVVRPHENFMLFATQNPPGLYGGRKTLSRAFRNRFLELHFDDIPEAELDTILTNRCPNVAPSDCSRIVAVYKELSRLRQSNRALEQKNSFATLRDLFRWALRDADNREQLANNGYMLLAERVRNPEERIAVKEVIERVMKVKIDSKTLYDAQSCPEIQSYNATTNPQGVVWTNAMRRLYVLVAHALRSNEPVLLVGETGCGKTTVCQMLADAFGKDLHILNAHQNTETGDLIGAQRPVRNRAAVLEQLRTDLIEAAKSSPGADSADLEDLISAYRDLPQSALDSVPEEVRQRIALGQIKAKALFEWSDGTLVQAMKEGQFFLLDEISLADDSVLERLNSVLESHRTMLLAEKGAEDSFVRAADGFQFFATMNPGGDYGKRELSPALRNRFTEIWVPALSEQEDVLQIVEEKLKPALKQYAPAIVHFAEWFGATYRSTAATSISVRDVLAWVKFMNTSDNADPMFTILHGAAMVYIDTLGANPAALLAINPDSLAEERSKCLQQLSSFLRYDATAIYNKPLNFTNSDNALLLGDFALSKGPGSRPDPGFAFDAPTTKQNAMRVIRALQVQKPILIEGSPGVGKTTLIAALATLCNKPLTRINLSEQTDLMDLFGSDVPVEGAEAGHFAWRDAPFLQAMQRGEWVLLDEMNLASQSVLEGLNACLDHRGEVYISELDQTFKRHPNFCVFAAQNPHHQGGGRKGLPSSFVNRFTVVYADVFKHDDLLLICRHNFPDIPLDIVTSVITFVTRLEHDIVYKRHFGSQGGPWEFNLRDILRWFQLLCENQSFLTVTKPSDFLNIIFRQRFRTLKDREEVDKIFTEVFGNKPPFRHLFHNRSLLTYQVGIASLQRDHGLRRSKFPDTDITHRLAELESIMICIQQNLPCILVGSSGSGKSTILQHLAAMSGKSLTVFPLNADIDTMDLVGGFEQIDPSRTISSFLRELLQFLETNIMGNLSDCTSAEELSLLESVSGATAVSSAQLEQIAQLLLNVSAKNPSEQLTNLADTCRELSTISLNIENARFEWVDGVLIKALEQGSWLVLDNANLCSASVLDRLNSLLEPSGFLSINEHCGPDGEPKIVKPHPHFRVFLTMDARHGELSRAMRNRAVEIFLDPSPPKQQPRHASSIQLEPTLVRFRNVQNAMDVESVDQEKAQMLQAVAFENLAIADMQLLARFDLAMRPFIPANLARIRMSTSKAFQSIAQNPANHVFLGALLQIYQKSDGERIKDAQILHPFQNSPLVSLLSTNARGDALHTLAFVLEALLEAQLAIETYKNQETGLDLLKPSKMNRLQRSLISGRAPDVAKDSTVKVSGFLEDSLRLLLQHLQNQISPATPWKVEKKTVSALLQFWSETYNLSISSNFEESTFQAHLGVGFDLMKQLSGLCAKSNSPPQLIEGFRDLLISNFEAGFKLKTGLSMEVLWKALRPTVAESITTGVIVSQIEGLARRFDTLRWKSSIMIDTMDQITVNFVKAYKLILTNSGDGKALIQLLTEEIVGLENIVASGTDHVTPYFSSDFESLRQHRVLDMMTKPFDERAQLQDSNTFLLADYPTTSHMHFATSTVSSRPLQAVDCLLGPTEKLNPVEGNFAFGILRRLNEIGEVDLKSLRLLEVELPLLGESIVLTSSVLTRDHLSTLSEVLVGLLSSLLGAHHISDEFLFANVVLNHRAEQPENITPQVLPVYTEHFKPLAQHLIAFKEPKPCTIAVKLRHLALAWAHFAIGAIHLYVPDKPFDPDERQRLERQQFNRVLAKMNKKLSAMKEFEAIFSGQDSNYRCQLLEEDIVSLGPPPENLKPICRPEKSELDQLCGEFKNLLRVVLDSEIVGLLQNYFQHQQSEHLQEIRLLQNNIRQIVRRISERFLAYRDLTVPAVSMLRCLQIALHVATVSTNNSPSKTQIISALCRLTPLMGGTPGPGPMDDSIVSSRPIDFLNSVAVQASVERVKDLDGASREALLKTIHICYDQWAKRLESDRAEAESKSGLYRFRGSAEDEEEVDEEQFNALFPSFEESSTENPKTKAAQDNVRDNAIALADIHERIFVKCEPPLQSVQSLLLYMTAKIGEFHDDEYTENNSQTKDILPGTLLRINEQLEALSSIHQVSDTYNFYNEPNLPESRKLVALIYSITNRFRQLQAVDEIAHMQPLADVLTSCQELLQFRHTEPLAKIITKVEKVHTFIHEWEFGGWASRANSARKEYDSLTKTIVDWRRLELSTWAKLFDMETKQCEDDAKSWWFVAYQVVVAAPLQMSDAPEQLREYSQSLLKDLEMYFATAIQGQFVQRLRLLRQLKEHLDLAARDYPSLRIIHDALSNFISMYAAYEKPVQDQLKAGRASLEKAMRDVLLLASWKDTNIVALRDSAKRSHHKLFKVVRKFRAVLGQPMDLIIKQGIPDQAVSTSEPAQLSTLRDFPSVDLSALEHCARFVPTWSQKSKRFINVSKTVSIMADAAQLPDSSVDGTLYLDSFLANVMNSTKELQKATPPTLTDDNKDAVKHLKSRKRKLFADTLKDLKQMGIKYNLGADALGQQNSLSLILANVRPSEALPEMGLDYSFYRAVDLASRAREATRQHSEDLSSREVARSVGFLEGLLQILLLQRNELCSAGTSLKTLKENVRTVRSLWAPGNYNITETRSGSSYPTALNWVPNILRVALKLIRVHTSLGKIESQAIIGQVSSWIDTFDELVEKTAACVQLPSGITSTTSEELRQQTVDQLQILKDACRNAQIQRPDLAFIIDQILPWTQTSTPRILKSHKKQSIIDLDAKLSTVCNAVLVALEKYQSILRDLPTSSDDDGWLAKSDRMSIQSIKALHIETINGQLKDVFDLLHSIDLKDPAEGKTAGAVFAVALPILQQYCTVVQDAITRYSQLHRSACKAHYILAKTFVQIATQGFCTPAEKSDAQDGKTEKFEGGTGLGDGEGAEDISKDIQDDENLEELAQEPQSGDKNDIEDEEDAVDMADGEMEGQMGDAEDKGEDDKGSDGEEEDGDALDEEAGDVDDLDHTAVDEKMWDGDNEKAEKDQEGDENKGKASKDEQVAAQDTKEQDEVGDGDEGDEEDEELAGAEQGEEVEQQGETEKHDPHADDGEALDLPDNMELDGNGDEKDVSDDDDMNDLSDLENIEKDDEEMDGGKEEEGAENADDQNDQDMVDDMDVVDLDEDNVSEGENTAEAGQKDVEAPDEETIEDQNLLRDRGDDGEADAENAAQSEVQGLGEDQNDDSKDEINDSASKTQREEGGDGGEASTKQEATSNEGDKAQRSAGEAPEDSRDDVPDSSDAQPFKKLGDILEKWHRQQTQIREPVEQEGQSRDQAIDPNVETTEFEHLQDESAEADDQALGTATEEQARALDESMAIDNESKEMPDQFQPDEVESERPQEDADVVDLEDEPETKEQETSDAYEGRAGASINQAKEDRDDKTTQNTHKYGDLEEEVEEVDHQLDHTHLDESATVSLRSAADARQEWTHYEGITRDLSLSLTEQLRLILAPTLATKMRGDFRTGKRLNIKRIIPYIASQYKRDKIWMRRSIPSKRSYQIMLAVDDSKSMGESGSGSLAFETLVMISKSLSMLEVGEICVVGFGENVKVAHDFDAPFSADAGPKIFQNFSFDQPRTDVTKLVRESISLFRAARAKASSSPSDLWQLQLIISDGVCDSSEHESIRRLLREAIEDRIMMVFVVVDDLKNKKKGESVMDLKEAKFVKDERTGSNVVKIERYLDTFPFQYYLIVSDVRELPGVLAALLRQWFAEVVDSAS